MNTAISTPRRHPRRAWAIQQVWRLSLGLGGALWVPAIAPGQEVVDPEHGIVAVERLLRGLGSVKRVLVIGAHPDDEDTALLTWLERGLGADAAYLSLTRGEGGQNLIGPELGVGLGLLRTGELIAARQLDGADQFFTRAYDFGYSKSAEETFRLWPRDSLLADVVAVIRRFRPQVIVSIFTGTPRDRHGQHQAAGILAQEAFFAAGDPQRIPGQLADGLRPWTPLKLYRSTRFDEGASTLTIETGSLDPLYGRSYHQIAMASRSRHRSQDMGRVESLGPQQTSVQLLESRLGTGVPGGEHSLFAGLDTTLAGMLPATGDSATWVRLGFVLGEYEQHLRGAREMLGERRWSGEFVSRLSSALSSLRGSIRLAEEAGPEADGLRFVLAEEETKLESVLIEAAGVIVDAFANDDLLVAGQGLEVEVQVWNGGSESVHVRRVGLRTPAGWLEAAAGTLSPSSLTRRRFRLTVPADAEPTRLYFLRSPLSGAAYTWPAGWADRGRPFGDPLIEARVDVAIAGQVVRCQVEAVHRFADQARGEVRRSLHLVPAVAVRLDPTTVAWPLGRREAQTVHVSVRAESLEEIRGRTRLDAPAGWTVTPREAAFTVRAPDETATMAFQVMPPADLSPGSYTLSAVAETTDGRRYVEDYRIIDYPHIRRSVLFSEATARVAAFDLSVDRGLRVGYVPGAGDGVPDAIAAMGVTVELLDDRAITSGDLSAYDVIVLGIRAYETNATLPAANERLLDWTRAGGTFIVQYQQYRFFNEGYAPYRLQARYPHDRVADEGAPVRLLVPDHPVFNRPNKIGPRDFEGWVQERGLYFAHEWDERYLPLLESADPGEQPQQGGLLLAPLGNGLYVYTGLALFRQLPAGVPGAYRLLANLLDLKG